MRRSGWNAVIALLLSAPLSSHALFHFAHISEIDAQVGGDSALQYVEIEMAFAGQTLVTDSILSAWDCGGTFQGELLTVPGNISTGGAGVRWIMATTNPIGIGGISPDFTHAVGIPTACGQVCWGAPGFSVPDPASWDHSDPTEYVDCVAYGGYTGTTGTGVGTPTPLTAGDATFSLTRVADTDDNQNDFAFGCPTPENNGGEIGMPVDPCTDPTTTTTVATSTTTTTTTLVTGGAGEPVDGKKLVLKTKAGKPEKNAIVLLAKDKTLTLGDGGGSPDDPTSAGGAFTFTSSSAGGAFTSQHTLTGEWKALTKKGATTGYKWKSKTSPIRLVLIKENKLLKVKGKGSGLTFGLANDPNPVTVELTIGGHRYCLELGGTTKHKPDKKFTAKNASAPASCP